MVSYRKCEYDITTGVNILFVHGLDEMGVFEDNLRCEWSGTKVAFPLELEDVAFPDNDVFAIVETLQQT
jgi:hypothetical protein